jgi:G3E family GTPase
VEQDLQMMCKIDGIITVVDAKHVHATLGTSMEEAKKKAAGELAADAIKGHLGNET